MSYLQSMECCGLLELVIGSGREKEIQQIIDDVKQANKSLENSYGWSSQDPCGAIIATTTNEVSAKLLKKLRFRKLFIVRNPNTENMVTVWCKKLTRPRRKRK